MFKAIEAMCPINLWSKPRQPEYERELERAADEYAIAHCKAFQAAMAADKFEDLATLANDKFDESIETMADKKEQFELARLIYFCHAGRFPNG